MNEPGDNDIVTVGLIDRGTFVEARLQYWRLLKPGELYYRIIGGNLTIVAKGGEREPEPVH